MKALFTLLATAAVAFVGCKDDSKGLLDPNAKVYINGVSAPQSAPEVAGVSKSGQVRLTPLEVVKQAGALENSFGDMGLGDQHRDFEKVRIVGASTWVVGSRGDLTKEIIESGNNILVTVDAIGKTVDTIAYIPNATMRVAETAIKTAHATQDYATCYRLFEEAYVFVPITGAEYKALQQQGLN